MKARIEIIKLKEERNARIDKDIKLIESEIKKLEENPTADFSATIEDLNKTLSMLKSLKEL